MAVAVRKSRPKPVKSVASLLSVTIMLLMAAAFSLVESSNLTHVTPDPPVTGVHNQVSDVSEDPWTDYRLPRDLVPTGYRVRLHPNLTTSTFTGDAVMRLKVAREVDRVIFHALNLTLRNIAIRPIGGTQGNLSHPSYYNIVDQRPIEKLEMYYIRLERNLTIGSEIDVTVKYNGIIIERDSRGLYKSYIGVGSQVKSMINTQLQDIDARRVFPCLDEPDLKAAFSVSIIREPQYISLSNTQIKSTEPAHQHCPNCVEDFYHDTPVMSTYLVAVAICDHSNISAYTTNGTLIRMFLPDEWIDESEYGLDLAVKFYDYCTEYFDFQLPLSKYDILGTYKHGGGMENWGLIVIESFSLRPSQQGVLEVDRIIIHEVAHQWLGNVVTMRWWNDFWLNEGLTTYMEYHGLALALGNSTFHLERARRIKQLHTMRKGVWLTEETETRLKFRITSREDVTRATERLAYFKGALIIWMLEAVLGPETVKNAFRIYVKENQYRNTQSKDLWDAFEMTSGVEDLSLMESWLVLPGHPVITLTRGDCVLNATQERFLMYKPERVDWFSSRSMGRPWLIPFTFITSDNVSVTKHFWMKYRSQVEHAHCLNSTTWIKGNVGGVGLYRVNYDEDNWMLLAQQLVEDHTIFPELERYQLLDDVFRLARVGLARYSTAFGMLQYLEKEKSATVWIMVVEHLEDLLHKLRLEEEYRLLQAYIWDLVQPKLEELGWGTSGDLETIDLQDKLLYLAKPNQTYTDMLLGIYAAWKEDPDYVIEERMVKRVFTAALHWRTVSMEEVDELIHRRHTEATAFIWGWRDKYSPNRRKRSYEHVLFGTQVDTFLAEIDSRLKRKKRSVSSKSSFEDLAETVSDTSTRWAFEAKKDIVIPFPGFPTAFYAIYVLCQSKDFDVLNRMIEKGGQAETVIVYNPSHLLTWRIVKQEWGKCVSRKKLKLKDCDFFDALLHLDDKFDYDEVRNFFKGHYWDNKEYERSLEELLSNIQWKETTMADLKTWLKVKMRTWALNEENYYPFPV